MTHANGQRSAPQSHSRPRHFEQMLRFAAVFAGAFLTAHIGNLFLGQHGLAVWWPLNGIVVALLMLVPRRDRWLVLAAATGGDLVAYVYSHFGSLSLWYALGDGAEIWLSAWSFRRLIGARLDFRESRHVLALVLTAILSAILPGLACAVLASHVGHHGFVAFFRTWWLADALGTILAAPAVLALADLSRDRRNVPPALWFEPATVVILASVTAAVSMTHPPAQLGGLSADARYLIFPLLIWSALRLSPQITAIGVMTAAIAAIGAEAPFTHPLGVQDAEEVVAIQIFLGVIGMTVLLLAAATQSMREALRRAVASEEALRRLTVQLDRAREDERARVSTEIHDVLGQELTALKFDIAAQERRREALQQLDRTIASVRRIAMELRPPALDHLGLPAALESHIQRFSRRTGIQARISIGQAGKGLTGEPAVALYRVVQEALTNVARHAEARSVSIDMTEDDGALLVEVSDDGRGCAAGAPDGGLGIVGMRERMTRIGGTFEFAAAPGGGVTIRCRVPLTPAPEVAA